MSDKNKPRNHRNNDIDDFFAQFDDSSTQHRNQTTRQSATIHGRSSSRSSSSSPRRSDFSRPQRQTEYRTSADREAAKAQRRAIANSQSGARRYAQIHNNEDSNSDVLRNSSSARNSGTSRPSDSSRRIAPNESGSFNSATSSERRNRNESSEKTSRRSDKSRRFAAADKPSRKKISDRIKFIGKSSDDSGKGSGNGSGRSRGKLNALRPPQGGKKIMLKFIVSCCLALVMAVGVYVGIVFLTAPAVNTDNIYEQLSQRSTLYDDQGKEIDSLYYENGNRTIIKYDDIPEDMINAVVSIEDKKFWSHHGFNWIRLVGAVKDSLFGGGQISGTSTITQQLARNVYLSDIKSQRNMGRKITEMYLSIVIEKGMTKKQIMEAYLNSIYLGFNSYGIQAASQAYFSKDAKNLDLLECASLAALPKSPNSYALVKSISSGSNTSSLPVISTSNSMTYLYNGDLSEDRRNLTLKFMCDEGYINENQKDEALGQSLKKKIHIGSSSDADESSYFTDYAINEVIDDIVTEYGLSKSEAKDMIYTGGLKIYTTMSSKVQNIMEDEFAKDSNYSGVGHVRKNSKGDIVDKSGAVVLRNFKNYFDSKKAFKLKNDEYKNNSDGGITILAGKRLNLYETKANGVSDISIEFKSMYTTKNRAFYFIESGALSIPAQYKSSDSDGNCVISGEFFKDYPNFFKKDGNNLVVSKKNYSLKQKVRQPQAAMAIIENESGAIKGMMGGRGATGRQLFNRATSTRQPGSNIKPIGVYGPALQMSYEYAQEGKDMTLDTSEGSSWGDYITAGSQINDKAMTYGGKQWPKNWYPGFKGRMSLRKSVEQSVNVNAVKTYLQIGADYSATMLKKVGITSLDEEGSVNDLNPAALALGGMTSGISPLEMTAAYEVFVNGGVYKEPIAYTKVVNSNNQVRLENKSKETEVYDEGVAWIMTDILKTVVTHGLGSAAQISGQPVGGKTGTTSDSYDLWFSGFTPQYTAALWQGNDINIELSSGSSQSARFWRNIMQRVCAGLPRGTFGERPENVERRGGEYYLKGTYSKVKGGGDKNKDKKKKTEAPTTVAPTTSAPTAAPTESTTAAPTTAPTQDND